MEINADLLKNEKDELEADLWAAFSVIEDEILATIDNSELLTPTELIGKILERFGNDKS